MSDPFVSIVVPVGPAHTRLAPTAVASCRWQTVPDWECILVNDTGQPMRGSGDERVRIINAPQDHGKRRPAVARNAGIAAARGTFTIFLDADDYLLPSAIQTFIRGHARHDKAYSYGHHYGLGRDGKTWAMFRPPDYNRAPRAGPKSHSTAGPNPVPTMQGCNLHPITALVPTWCLREVGGFDEDAPGFEDWTVWLRLAMTGFCGERIYGPVFVYRIHEGHMHRPDAAGGQALMDAVTAPYRINGTGEIPMAGCGCGGGAAKAKEMARQLAETFGSEATADTGQAVLEYIGPGSGTQTFRHPESRREYRAGNNPARRYIQVTPEDIPYLLDLGLFRRQQPPAPFVPPPVVEEATPVVAPQPVVPIVEPELVQAILDQQQVQEGIEAIRAANRKRGREVSTELLTPAKPPVFDPTRAPDRKARPKGTA